MSKEQLNILVLNMGSFIILLKLDVQRLEKHKHLKKKRIKQKNQYLNLKVSANEQNIIFFLEKNGFKLISRQEKNYFYHMLLQRYILGKSKKWIFHLPIGSTLKTKLIGFHHNFHLIEHVQHDKNTSVFISLAFAMYDAREHIWEKAISYQLESFLKSESSGYLDRIKFANKIITNCFTEEGYQHLCYKMAKWKNTGELDILNYISDRVVLVQLIDTTGNFNHAVSIIGGWRYYSNYKRALCLIKKSLNIISSPYRYKKGV